MKATRVGDSTSGTCDVGLICCPHGRSGTNSTGSPTLIIDGQAAHRLGDSGSCNCPHGGSFKSTAGSSILIVDGKPQTLIGHTTVCSGCGMSGSHTSGSDTLEVSS